MRQPSTSWVKSSGSRSKWFPQKRRTANSCSGLIWTSIKSSKRSRTMNSSCVLPLLPSWVTSTTVRPSCLTPSVTPTLSLAKPVASLSTSVLTRSSKSTRVSNVRLPSLTPRVTKRSPLCVLVVLKSPTLQSWWSQPTTESCPRRLKHSTTLRQPMFRSLSRSTRLIKKARTLQRFVSSSPNLASLPKNTVETRCSWTFRRSTTSVSPSCLMLCS